MSTWWCILVVVAALCGNEMLVSGRLPVCTTINNMRAVRQKDICSLYANCVEQLTRYQTDYATAKKTMPCCKSFAKVLRSAHCDVACDVHCTEKRCVARRSQCDCHAGYLRDVTSDICEPVCPAYCTTGRCATPTVCLCKSGYKFDAVTRQCVPKCPNSCLRKNGHCLRPGECVCNVGYKYDMSLRACIDSCPAGHHYDSRSQRCAVDCTPNCLHSAGVCRKPHVCQCPALHVLDGVTGTCVPVPCDAVSCVHGHCNELHVCECESGYMYDDAGKTCRQDCARSCHHGHCVAGNICACDAGYSWNTYTNNCEPVCEDGCKLGTCILPNICHCPNGFFFLNGSCTLATPCPEGYQLNTTTFICEIQCSQSCGNGTCVGVNFCRCDPGFTFKNNTCELSCGENQFYTDAGRCDCITGYFFNHSSLSCEEYIEETEISTDEYRLEGTSLETPCPEGYQLNTTSFICEIQCPQSCGNGTCVGVNFCRCDPGFTFNNNTCELSCGENQFFTDAGRCDCITGYMFNHSSLSCEEYIEDTSIGVDEYSLEGTSLEPVEICRMSCSNGKCTGLNWCECDPGFVYNRNTSTCDAYCADGCGNGICLAPDVCECLPGYRNISGHCRPTCTGECANGNCVAPDICECPPGYLLDATSDNCTSRCAIDEVYEPTTGNCETICTEGFVFNVSSRECQPNCTHVCENGECVPATGCVCDEGYEFSGYRCEPVCRMNCSNGICVAPNQCECDDGFLYSNVTESCGRACDVFLGDGYVADANGTCVCDVGFFHSELTDRCEPVCERGCGRHGMCIGPNQCSCPIGYQFNVVSATCKPVCRPACRNGYCKGPNRCVCNTGYRWQKRRMECVPLCDENDTGDLCNTGVELNVNQSTVIAASVLSAPSHFPWVIVFCAAALIATTLLVGIETCIHRKCARTPPLNDENSNQISYWFDNVLYSNQRKAVPV